MPQNPEKTIPENAPPKNRQVILHSPYIMDSKRLPEYLAREEKRSDTSNLRFTPTGYPLDLAPRRSSRYSRSR